MKYLNYQYIYPPRPKNAVSPGDLDMFDNNSMIAQCKLNGSNATIYTNGQKIIVMNRHGQRLTNVKVPDSEILSLYKGKGWVVLNCEYMNKSKNSENGNIFNHKFCIFDILVYDGNYLIGKTFQERINLLDGFYGKSDNYLTQVSENIFKIETFYTSFQEKWEELTKIDMIEGLVLKRKSAKLEVGSTENNNTNSQIKVRKATKNYKY
jgi:hypothetical protein